MKGEHLSITSDSILQCYLSRDPTHNAGAVASPECPLTETRMRKAAFTILGALLIAGSTVQMATASEQRTGRGHHRWDRAYDQLKEPSYAAPRMRDGYSRGGGLSNPAAKLSNPAANETRSCDVIWCYPN